MSINAPKLLENGILYPRVYSRNGKRPLNHHVDLFQEFEAQQHSLLTQINQYKPAIETVIFSAENLWKFEKQRISKILKTLQPAEILVIFSVRHLVFLIESGAKQVIKAGNFNSPIFQSPNTPIFKSKFFDYRYVYKNWTGHLNSEQFKFLEFNPMNGRCLIQRFLAAAGVEDLLHDEHKLLENVSPGANESLFMRNYLKQLNVDLLPKRTAILELFKTFNFDDEIGDTMFRHETLVNVDRGFKEISDFVRAHSGATFFENDVENFHKKLSQPEGEINRYLKDSYKITE